MRLTFPKNLKIYILLVMLCLIYYLPVPFFLPLIKPQLIIMLIFFFSMVKDIKPNLFFLILLGLLDDILGHNLIGITSLCYIIVSLIASSNNKALNGQKFNIVWLTFSFSLVLVTLVKMAANMLFHENIFIIAMILELLLSILIYPSLHLIFTKKIHWFR